MITKFKQFENNQTIENFYDVIEVGTVLIAKCDIYIRHFTGRIKWMTPILDSFGDKLFVQEGKTKKISKIDYNGIHLSGFIPGQRVETLDKFFTLSDKSIKDLELKKDLRKYNL